MTQASVGRAKSIVIEAVGIGLGIFFGACLLWAAQKLGVNLHL